MANRYGNKQKVKGGVLKRSRRRAKALGREGVLEGGVTGAEARQLREYSRNRGGSSGGARGGVKSRALDRIDYLSEHGGVPGGVSKKGGISRREARKVRSAYLREKRNDPLAPRGGRALLREAEALTQTEFGPQEAEVGRQRTQEQGRQNVLYGPGGWFERYQQQVAQAAQQQATADQAFQAGQNHAAEQAYQTFQAQQAAEVAKQAETAAKGGTSVDPAIAAQAQQAALGRQNMAQNAAARLAQQGSANSAYMNSLSVGAGQQRMEGVTESNARIAKIDSIAAELARARGSYKTAAMGELKDKERTYDLNRQAFGLDVAQAAEDARHNREGERENRRKRRAAVREQNRDYRRWKKEFGADRADEMWDRRDKDRGYQLDVDKFGETRAQNRWNRKHPAYSQRGGVPTAGPKHGFSEAEQDKFDSAVNLLQAIDRKKGGNHVRKTRVDALTALVQDKHIPPRIARRALKYYLKKGKGGGQPGAPYGGPRTN